MSLDNLRHKIENRSARIAVIGLGYVGIPVACEFARVGFEVLGIDVRAKQVEMINAGRTPITGKEPGLQELISEVILAGRLRATDDYDLLHDRDVILVCVETPVKESREPDYTALRSALSGLAVSMKTGALVIIESTIAPGTMQDVVVPELESASRKCLNEGFYLGNCPERVMPGKLLANLRNLSRVIGGMSEETAQVIRALYSQFVQAEIDCTDCLTAELVKTVENAYRDVQIAFANEVALICETVGGDVWKVRELVNKSPGRMMLLPGAGVGGHCILKDPWLLAYSARKKGGAVELIPAARKINDTMPDHMVSLVMQGLFTTGISVSQARILVMGFTYLEDSDDTRNSPSAQLVNRLLELGASVVIHDPYVSQYSGDLIQAARGCDLAVLMVKHGLYSSVDLARLSGIMRHSILVDGRAAFSRAQAERAGFRYIRIGMANHLKDQGS